MGLKPIYLGIVWARPLSKDWQFKISSPKDYLAYKLTNVLRSEPTDALATVAFDYHCL